MELDLVFKKVELQDKEKIESYTKHSNINICDFAFANIFAWSEKYLTSWAEWEDSLIISFVRDGKTLYLPIIAKDHSKLESTISMLINKSISKGENFILMSVTDEYLSIIEEIYPNRFDIIYNRDGCDYIYNSEDLATLKGKKLQSKRNHINKFQKLYPNYKVEFIDNSNKDECLELSKLWAGDKINETDFIDEYKMIERFIGNIKELDAIAIAIRVDDRLVAFSIASAINDKCFDVHIEKADTSYEGSFSIINKEMANIIIQKYELINREEDLGIEGLRKAKLSYNPKEILCKKILRLKDK